MNQGELVRMKYINIIMGVFMAIFSVAISVIFTLNLGVIYKIAIPRFNLVAKSGFSSERLMGNYNSMINYLRNPFEDKLIFNDFPMSVQGKIHFEEVKRIFMGMYIIIIVFIVIYIIFKCIESTSKIIKESLILNYCSNTIISIISIGIIAMSIDFSKAFEIFHKIFFRNDYWLFDPKTDPIINVLPEELFMIYGVTIVGLLLLQAIAYKYIGYKAKKFS